MLDEEFKKQFRVWFDSLWTKESEKLSGKSETADEVKERPLENRKNFI